MKWRALLICLSVIAQARQLPDSCKLPAAFQDDIRNTPEAKVYDAIGAWFAERGNLTCALAAFQEAVHVEPASAEAHYDLGVAQVRMHQLAAAVREFRLALKKKPDMMQAQESLGAVLLDMGHSDEAEAVFESALAIDPNSIFVLDHLAQALAAGRHYAAAIRYWNKALALQPVRARCCG